MFGDFASRNTLGDRSVAAFDKAMAEWMGRPYPVTASG
jgi:hypothetical protein